MKTIIKVIKTFSILLILLSSNTYAESTSSLKPNYDKVYRSDRIGDSYHFLLLSKSGIFYHLYTNRTDTLTSTELKSNKLVDVLKQKQAWGQSFPKKGAFTIKNGKFYTKLLWNRIKIVSKKEIKYLNKTFYIQ